MFHHLLAGHREFRSWCICGSRCQATKSESELWIIYLHSVLFQMLFFQESSKCLSFKINTTRNRSLISWKYRAGQQPSFKWAPVEKTWRRELPTQVSGGCILNPTDWKLRSWITFSLSSRVSSTYTSCHCHRSCMTQSLLAHFLTHRFLISCEKISLIFLLSKRDTNGKRAEKLLWIGNNSGQIK